MADKILDQQITQNPDAMLEQQLQKKDQFILEADEDEEKAKKSDLMNKLVDVNKHSEVGSDAETEKRGAGGKDQNADGDDYDDVGDQFEDNESKKAGEEEIKLGGNDHDSKETKQLD